ncbi:hypothetical protein [Nitrospira sp. Kam-Ns4a]
MPRKTSKKAKTDQRGRPRAKGAPARQPVAAIPAAPAPPAPAVAPPPRAAVGLIDAPRDLICVHGVQWQRDYEIKGYSRPTQDLMRNQAPTVNFRFHEVLWSDVVERDEQALIAGAGVIADILQGNYAAAVFDLFKLIGQRTDFQLDSQEEAFQTPLPSLIAGKGGFVEKAVSAILDIVFYFSDLYGPRIRAKVREALDPLRAGPPPILFGHSLGSVILLDIIREDFDNGRAHVGGFVSAGSPIGLFYPDRDRPEFAELDWVNFYDTDDLVTFWNPLRKRGYTSVTDQRIDTHELPFYSHVKYWTNSVLARELVDKCLTA